MQPLPLGTGIGAALRRGSIADRMDDLFLRLRTVPANTPRDEVIARVAHLAGLNFMKSMYEGLLRIDEDTQALEDYTTVALYIDTSSHAIYELHSNHARKVFPTEYVVVFDAVSSRPPMWDGMVIDVRPRAYTISESVAHVVPGVASIDWMTAGTAPETDVVKAWDMMDSLLYAMDEYIENVLNSNGITGRVSFPGITIYIKHSKRKFE